MSQPESNLSRRIIKRLRERFGGLWVKVHGGPYQQVGLPDIVGCMPSTCPRCGYGPLGLFIGLETKMPGGKPSAIQTHTLDQIREAGGVAGVIYSAADAEAIINAAFLNRPS